MLSIGALSVGKELYYTKLASVDYYTGSGEPPGRWWGSGATALGLSGEVTTEQLSRLTAGFTPDGMTALVRNAGSEKRRAGFDLTFSAPKSVSVLWSQVGATERAAIEAAHREAVEGALGYLEREAAKTRRGVGGASHVEGTLAVALFDHCTARAQMNQAPDPHLHTHSLVMNLCLGDDGQWGTLDARHVFKQKMTAGVLYRAELIRVLQEKLCLVASRRERFCELDGVGEGVLRAFSKRRAAIEAKLGALGETSPVAAARATQLTRKTKMEVTRSHLFQEWQTQGSLLGFSHENVRVEQLERNEQDVVRFAVPKALEALTEKKAHFAKRDLVRAVAELVEPQAVGIDAITGGVGRAIENLVPLEEHRGEQQFTTRGMLHLERTLLCEAKALKARWHRASDVALDASLSKHTLSDEQANAVRHITQGTSLALVSGLAGTGKTTLIRAAKDTWEADGYRVLGAALAAQAARELERGSSVQSASIHRTVHELEKGQLKLDRKTVLVIDEASMVGTRLLQKVTRFVEQADAKLVLVGDEKQLAAIEAGNPFAALIERCECARLTDIRRQDELWARRAATLFATGETRRALREYAERDLVHVGANRAQCLSRLTADWRDAVAESGIEQVAVLTGSRADVREVNASIQMARYAAKELEGEGVQLEKEHLFAGDRVRFRRNSHAVMNGDTGVVVALAEEARCLTVKLDSGTVVDVDLDEYSDIELGYAGTTHSAQGQTVDRCLVFCGDSMQGRALSYVQGTRARAETRFYVDRRTAGHDLEKLARSMEQDAAGGMAIDLLPEVA